MQAKVTHPEGFELFVSGVVDHYPCGTVLQGRTAERAVAAGKASQMLTGKKAPKNKAMQAPENKAQ